jgi:hypothetical protein
MLPAARSRLQDLEMPTVAPLLVPPPQGQQNQSLDQHDQQNRLHDTLRHRALSNIATTATLRKMHVAEEQLESALLLP